jgi:hypothetical protein
MRIETITSGRALALLHKSADPRLSRRQDAVSTDKVFTESYTACRAGTDFSRRAAYLIAFYAEAFVKSRRSSITALYTHQVRSVGKAQGIIVTVIVKRR